jgi:hypothetical protein
MLFLILLLLIFILIVEIFYKKNTTIEGATTMQFTDPGLGKDPVYLSTLNASNIVYLKNKVDELVGLKQQLTDLSTKVDQNSTALTQLSTHMSDTANKSIGRDPNSTDPIPQASGLN